MTVEEALKRMAKKVATLEKRVEQLEIASDDRQPIAGDPWHEEVEVPELVTRGKDATQIDIPAPDQKTRERRAALSLELGFENLPNHHQLPAAEAINAFVRGGSLWLYNYDRDFCMSLTPELRLKLVRDMAALDKKLAAEMSADLLKDESPGEPDIAMQVAEATW